ncbi:hypothetical protein GOBAR_DD28849 [Gossypium barbadense]|nr:hypothetical protein GOBAR_DD28849 [Gossypium barbadense]
MNAPIIDPLQGDFPEVIEEYLEHGLMKCIAFNRRVLEDTTGPLPVPPFLIWEKAVAPPSRNKFPDGAPYTLTAACFNKNGDLVYVGNSKGEILIIDHKNVKVLAMVPISSGAVVKNIVFSRNGQHLLTNSSDRIIRIYENILPLKDGLGALHDLNKTIKEEDTLENVKAVGSKCLVLFREFQDSITKTHWKAPCFSGDGEWVISASASKGEHKIYIWDRAGHLVKILEGPKEQLIDLAWHPVHPIIVSVSLTGLVYIWAKDYTENWSAFAPDFKELEENEEYVEREDEFDLVPETEKVKESDINEDDEVDIVTVEKDPFSDSDMSQDELCFLPATPCPDDPQQQDKFVGSSSKLIDSNHSGSPLSEENGQNGQNGQAAQNASSPLEGKIVSLKCIMLLFSEEITKDIVLAESFRIKRRQRRLGISGKKDTAGGNQLKRKRKLSEKGLELQAEKVRKPMKPLKSTGRLSKTKNKSVVDQDSGNGLYADDGSDDY